MNIALKPSKSYIGYPSITFLGQRIDNFGVNIFAEKFEIIRTIKFPTKFKDFETYIGLINYLSNYIPYYVALIKPWQQRKTALLRSFPIKNNARKTYSRLCKLNIFSKTEKAFFEILQLTFSSPFYLVHHNFKRSLYIDVDALR